MPLKAMIFDMDGTLGDTMPIVMDALKDTFRRYAGREYSTPEIIEMFGPSEEGVIQRRVPAEAFDGGELAGGRRAIGLDPVQPRQLEQGRADAPELRRLPEIRPIPGCGLEVIDVHERLVDLSFDPSGLQKVNRHQPLCHATRGDAETLELANELGGHAAFFTFRRGNTLGAYDALTTAKAQLPAKASTHVKLFLGLATTRPPTACGGTTRSRTSS